MKNRRVGTAAILASSLFALSLTGSAYAEVLSGDQLQTEVIGKTLVAKRMGMTMRMTFNEDGTITAKSAIRNGQGTWTISGNTLCIEMPMRRSNDDPCQTFSVAGDAQLTSSNGMNFKVE